MHTYTSQLGARFIYIHIHIYTSQLGAAPNRWKVAKEALVEADSSQEQVPNVMYICMYTYMYICIYI